jgi:molybdenum cofactor biosynthesis enzyme MoaA
MNNDYDIRMPLYEVRLSVTGNCNFNCIYCGPFADGKKALGFGEIQLDQVSKLATFLKKQNIHIQLTGGEPTLHKDLPKIIEILSKKGIKNIGLSTNGYLLNKKMLKKLKSVGLNEIHFHFPSLDNIFYKKTTGKEIKDLPNLILYSKKIIKTELNTPITPTNVQDFEKILNFCKTNSLNIKLIEEVSNNKTRINYPKLKLMLIKWFKKNKIPYTRKVHPRKYGDIFTTNFNQIRIAPVTPNLIEKNKGKKVKPLLDGRFWVGGNEGKYVFTPSYFIKCRIGSFDDFKETYNAISNIYKK